MLENKVGLHGKIHIAKYGFTYRGEKVRSSWPFVTLESVVNKTNSTGSHPGAHLEPSRTVNYFRKKNPSMFDWVLKWLWHVFTQKSWISVRFHYATHWTVYSVYTQFRHVLPFTHLLSLVPQYSGPYTKLYGPSFSRILIEFTVFPTLARISPYSAKLRENTEQKTSCWDLLHPGMYESLINRVNLILVGLYNVCSNFLIRVFIFKFWTLNLSWTTYYEITIIHLSVRPSALLSLNFLKIGSLVFSDVVHGYS